MRNLRGKTAALVGVAAVALLALLVLAIVQGRYDTLLVGIIAFAGVLLAVRGGVGGLQRSVDRVAKNTAGIAEGVTRLEGGVTRLEDTVASSPRMLDGSQERQLAETAARFDWLARRHTEQAERLDAFKQELEATVARQHEEVLALLRSGQAPAVVTSAPEPDGGRGTAAPDL